MQAFEKLPRLVKIILLLIPGVNWVVEIVIRLLYLVQKPNTKNLLGFVLYLILGMLLGYVDLVWIILKNKLFLTD